MTSFALFDTPLGACALAWNPTHIVGCLLPDVDAQTSRARLERWFPSATVAEPSGPASHAIDSIRSLLDGNADDLTDLPLDMTGVPDFHRRVYELARQIRPGSTLTYGEVAARLGEPGAARAVGQTLGANPFAPIVPCHRILAANGRSGGFSAPGGVRTKLRLLEIERAVLGGTPGLFDRPLL